MTLKGRTVILINKIRIGTDGFGAPIYQDQEIEVPNVLIAPSLSDDVTSSLTLYGKKAVYTLGIPKGDTNDWEDREVIFFGKRFRTFGALIEGQEELTPLAWNKKISAERYE